jgi:hypothetical protein
MYSFWVLEFETPVIRDREPLGQVEGEGAPAAAELEDLLAVRDPSPLDVEAEHRLLGLVEALAPVG